MGTLIDGVCNPMAEIFCLHCGDVGGFYFGDRFDPCPDCAHLLVEYALPTLEEVEAQRKEAEAALYGIP